MKQRMFIILFVFIILLILLPGCTTTGNIAISDDEISYRDAIDMKIELSSYYLISTNLTVKFITDEYLYVTQPNNATELNTDYLENMGFENKELNYEIRSKRYNNYEPKIENVIILIYEEDKTKSTRLATDFIKIKRY